MRRIISKERKMCVGKCLELRKKKKTRKLCLCIGAMARVATGCLENESLDLLRRKINKIKLHACCFVYTCCSLYILYLHLTEICYPMWNRKCILAMMICAANAGKNFFSFSYKIYSLQYESHMLPSNTGFVYS